MKGFRGSRPFPLDTERKARCLSVLRELCITSTELAKLLGVDRAYISALISGRELSVKNEARVAQYLGVPVDYLFPQRSPAELAVLRERENAEKERRARLRAAREELRQRTADAASA